MRSRRLPGLLIALLLLTAGLAGCIGSEPTEPAASEADGTEGTGLGNGFSWSHVPDGTFAKNESGSQLLEQGPYDVLEPELVHIESPVGGSPTELMVVRPDVPAGTQVPVILTSTPYAPPLDADWLLGSKTYQRFGEQMVPHGYAYALHSARGYGGSGGCPDLLGNDEAEDLDAAITWLGTQDWSSGDIGVVGISYDGGTAWLAAAIENPHVRTIVPIAGLSDWFQVAYRNGTAGEYGQASWDVAQYTLLFSALTAPSVGTSSPALWTEHAACPVIAEGAQAQMYSQAAGERDPEGFWAERDLRERVASGYDGSLFAVHGFDDWNTPTSMTLPWATELDVPTKMWFGWWGHEVPGDPDDGDVPMELVRWDWAEVLKNWFDRWLLHDETVDLGPPVQVADIGGQWRSDTTWPPANTTEARFVLGADGTLTADAGEATPGRVEVSDPHVACDTCPVSDVRDAVDLVDAQVACTSCPTFTSAPLEHPLYVSGHPRVHVTVVPSAPQGVLSATLAMTVDGETTEFGWGIIDLRFADGGETGQPVAPGEPLLLKLQLDATEAHVPAGAELSLTLDQSGYGSWRPMGPSPPLELVVGEGVSTLALDTYEPITERFFEPPG